MRNCTGCSMKNRSRFVSSEKDTRCKYKWEIQTFVITFRFIFEHRWPAYSASCPFLSFFLSNFSKFDRYIRFDFVESFVIKNRRTYEIYIYIQGNWKNISTSQVIIIVFFDYAQKIEELVIRRGIGYFETPSKGLILIENYFSIGEWRNHRRIRLWYR